MSGVEDHVATGQQEPMVGRAPGKAILVGEHFVVHGAPSVAVPVPRHVTVAVTRIPGDWKVAPQAVEHFRSMLRHLGEDPAAMTVQVESTLPFGAGLGGSAALAVALVRALGTQDREAVRQAAHALEKLAHGNPSGVDDTVAAYEQPVRFVRGAMPEPIDAPGDLPLWIGLTPSGASTHEAVAGVGRLRQESPEFFQERMTAACDVAELSLAALRAGDWPGLGAQMSRNHQLLVDVGVSTPLLDRLVAGAVAAGAWGAKLTGGGLGGAMLVLAPADAPIADTLLKLGATSVIGPSNPTTAPDTAGERRP